jgi:hypothetical protein
MMGIATTSCNEGFRNHQWQGGDTCLRCGASKEQEGPSEPRAEGIPGQETLLDIEQETVGAVPPRKDAAKAAEKTKWIARKERIAEEDKTKKLLARANAKTAIGLLEGAKALAGSQFFGIPPEAFQLLPDEEQELVAQLQRLIELYDFDINSPYMMLGMFLATEAKITYRQWQSGQELVDKAVERTGKASA